MSATPAHTPGPWWVGGNSLSPAILAGDGKIADLHQRHLPEAERAANAALIAASPDLLAVCVALVDPDGIAQGHGGLYAHLQKLRDLARAAIAKAVPVARSFAQVQAEVSVSVPATGTDTAKPKGAR